MVYSPVAMAADLQENYEANPTAFKFIRDVPVDWDQTRVLSGAIGEHVVVARKDRNSADWYVGGVTNEAARDARVDLGFLPAGKRYTAHIYRDGPTAEAGAKGKDMAYETRSVARGDVIAVRMAPGGGFAIRLAAPRR